MKVFPKFICLWLLLFTLLRADPYDNYLADVENTGENDYSDLNEFAPRTLDETDATSTDGDEDKALTALSSATDADSIDELTVLGEESSNGLLNINTNSEIEHNRNYVKISEDLKAYEDAYKACLSNISDNDFSMQEVEKCVGVNYQFVYDDIDFEKRKILSRTDNAIRTAMITICYNAAGADLVMDNACDLIQKDTLELMWEELNFEILIEFHREKYVFVHAKLPEATFTPVINRFKDIYSELSELIEELYAHRDLTIMRLKRDVDERTALIDEKFRYQEGHPTPKLKKDVITINEILLDQPFNGHGSSNWNGPSNFNNGQGGYDEGMDFGEGQPYIFNDFNDIFSDWSRKRHLASPGSPRSLPAKGPQVQNRGMKSVSPVGAGVRQIVPQPNKIQYHQQMAPVQKMASFRKMRRGQFGQVPLRVRNGRNNIRHV